MSRYLPIAIVVLALLDGLIHLWLGVPAMSRFGLRNTLSVLFLLNFLGYVALTAAFYFLRQSPIAWRRALDGVFILYAAATIVMWAANGARNPQGLGYASKAIEVLLILALLAHAYTLGREVPAMAPAGVAKDEAL